MSPMRILLAIGEGDYKNVDVRKCTSQQLDVLRGQGVLELELKDRQQAPGPFPWETDPEGYMPVLNWEKPTRLPVGAAGFNSPDPHPDAPGPRFLPQPRILMNVADYPVPEDSPVSARVQWLSEDELRTMRDIDMLREVCHARAEERKVALLQEEREGVPIRVNMREPRNYHGLRLSQCSKRQIWMLREWDVLPEVMLWQPEEEEEEEEEVDYEDEDEEEEVEETADEDDFEELQGLQPIHTLPLNQQHRKQRITTLSRSPSPSPLQQIRRAVQTGKMQGNEIQLLKELDYEDLLALHDEDNGVVELLPMLNKPAGYVKQNLDHIGDDDPRSLGDDVYSALKECELLPYIVARMPRRKNRALSPVVSSPTSSRKRSLDEDATNSTTTGDDDEDRASSLGSRSTPTKRVRMHEPEPSLAPGAKLSKRGSEELEDATATAVAERKRAKMAGSFSHSPSLPPTSDSEP
jgi:hypothetical protein